MSEKKSQTDEEIIYAALGNFQSTDNREKSRQAFARIKKHILKLEADIRKCNGEPRWQHMSISGVPFF